MNIEICVHEARRVIDDKVVGVHAQVNITIPLDGSYLVPELEEVRDHLITYLDEALPKCLVALKKGGAE